MTKKTFPKKYWDTMSPEDAGINLQKLDEAKQWLGLDTVLPCHYVNPDCEDVREFVRHIEKAQRQGQSVPKAVVLKPGEVFTIE